MKTKLLLIITFVIYGNTQAQFGPQQIISTNAVGAASVHATDVDGDGDMDVFSGSSNQIAWYENTDGQGNFSLKQVIIINGAHFESIDTADLDGDGDVDLLSADWSNWNIAWYENTDGQGTFGPQQIIATNEKGAISVFATDIDGDEDMDVLFAS